jgi:hypothetical protein
VEHVTLEHKVHDRSSEEHIRVDRKEWLELLLTFSHVKALRVNEGLIADTLPLSTIER